MSICRFVFPVVVPLLLASSGLAHPISYFQHVIVIVQENRTPSILRFAAVNFGMQQGALGFADQRSTTNLRAFYDFLLRRKKFLIPTTVPASILPERYVPPRTAGHGLSWSCVAMARRRKIC